MLLTHSLRLPDTPPSHPIEPQKAIHFQQIRRLSSNSHFCSRKLIVGERRASLQPEHRADGSRSDPALCIYFCIANALVWGACHIGSAAATPWQVCGLRESAWRLDLLALKPDILLR